MSRAALRRTDLLLPRNKPELSKYERGVAARAAEILDADQGTKSGQS